VTGAAPWRPGGSTVVSRMVRITFCLKRRSSLSHEAFLKYWYEVHAPLVRKHQQVLGILRYVQVHTDAGPFTQALRAARNAPEPFDGVAELWWESRHSLAEGAEDEGARAAGLELLEDERRFIDLPRSPIWLGEERPIVCVEEPFHGTC
jgi:uncharacterized protein (TIGR02118 family)